MAPRRRRGLRTTLGLVILGAWALFAVPSAGASHTRDREPLPIVFVHGGAGSGAQYDSVARRFASNGYPESRIAVYEYNSLSSAAVAAAPAGIESLINELRARFDVEQVNLVGHSLGTTVSNAFLDDPARRALVRRYVGVDGRSNLTCRDVWEPDPSENIKCMGIWAQPQGDRAVGSTNHSFEGQQTHVEAATSPESFAFQYEFFTGRKPRTTLILPERPGQVRISGRAVNFPENTGAADATLRVWEVRAATGERRRHKPVHTVQIAQDGSWGPLKVNGKRHYEFVISREGAVRQHHLYYQPFIRDSHLVRLLTSPPDGLIPSITNIGPNHTASVVMRYREWWTTHPSGRNDVLEISTRSRGKGNQAPVNALQNVTDNGDIGIHIHDDVATPQVSSLNLLPIFPGLPFQTGVDVFMPATDPPDGVVTFRNLPRGDATRAQVLNIPNWASEGHATSVVFNDYVQDIDTWRECKRAKPSPCKRHCK
jgi:pimeloyl-ACP methyl ester carboxylesterase